MKIIPAKIKIEGKANRWHSNSFKIKAEPAEICVTRALESKIPKEGKKCSSV
jgi:hypothetical protein